LWQAEQNSGVRFKSLNYGFGMALRVLHDFPVGNFTGDAVAVFINHESGNAQHEAAISDGRLQLLNRVAGGAGEALFIEGAVYLRILS
jgi:hypothetical protein